jgi:hypothetical protein
VEDIKPDNILSRLFFSDLHVQDLYSTPATLASLHAILQEQDSYDTNSRGNNSINIPDDKEDSPNGYSRLPHITYKTTQHIPPINAFTDSDYFTAAFPTLFPFGIGGHLGDANKDCLKKIFLKVFIRYAMLYYSLL